jgi:hypothetical protein
MPEQRCTSVHFTPATFKQVAALQPGVLRLQVAGHVVGHLIGHAAVLAPGKLVAQSEGVVRRSCGAS